jgi:hypothetical protein
MGMIDVVQLTKRFDDIVAVDQARREREGVRMIARMRGSAAGPGYIAIQ